MAAAEGSSSSSSHPSEYLHEGNWVPMFVFVALIPVIAAAVMAYSNWADRASERAGTDVEMAAAYASIYQRIWFPWRDAVSASEGGAPRAGPSSTTTTAPPPRPPVLPASFRAGVRSGGSGSRGGAGSGRGELSSSANAKKHLAPNVTVTVTAPTPSPPPPPPPPAAPRVPERAAYPPSRPPRSPQPYDHSSNSNSNSGSSGNERWGEGPYGYGRRRDTQRSLTPAKAGFEDVPF